MNFQRPITATITIGDQPAAADLEQLKQEGYKGVVNLRNDGEPDQPLSTSEEGNQVRALGMKYLHYGVGVAPLSEAGVTGVCDFVDETPKGRTRSWSTVDEGPRRHRPLTPPASGKSLGGEEVFAKGKALGLEVDGGLKCWSRAIFLHRKRCRTGTIENQESHARGTGTIASKPTEMHAGATVARRSDHATVKSACFPY